MTAMGAEGRVLDEAGGFGAMTGVMAIMLFLTVLAMAGGLGAAAAARLLDRDLAGRLTVQVMAGAPAEREALAARVARAMQAVPGVARVRTVDRAELTRLLQPWLGEDGADPALPVPAMIDAAVADPDGPAPARLLAAVRRIDPTARIDRHQAWMTPVSSLMRSAVLLAFALVVLMAAATAAVVVLAVRAGLQTHRATIEIMHMLGSTDLQVARLFQRRIATDAAIGGAIGGAAALAVVALMQAQLAGLGSELLGAATLGTRDWVVLALLPFGFVLLGAGAARLAVLGTLRRVL